jgi:hypothetical protein
MIKFEGGGISIYHADRKWHLWSAYTWKIKDMKRFIVNMIFMFKKSCEWI